MDTVQLLTPIVALLVFLAITLRRSITRNAAVPSPIPPTIEVTDPAVARGMLFDHADVFSNRPLAIFPVNFDAKRHNRISHNITIVPHGTLWRALRCNLNTGVLHRSRPGSVVFAPLHRDAVEALVADLQSAQCPSGGGGGVVLLRDALHMAVHTLSVRLCFGDGVATSADVRAMQVTLREFFDNFGEARDLATSWLARLVHWTKWQHIGGTFDRLIGLILPLIAARQRMRSQFGDDGAGGSTIRPYVDSLVDLRVPDDDDVNDGGVGARRPLTDHEMASLVWEFISGSTESVVTCVEWTLAHLVADPEIQDRLHRELAGAGEGAIISDDECLRDLPFLRAVIHESLRLHPPVPIIMRDVVGEEDGMVTRYHFMVGPICRDGNAWTDPDVFRPERFLAGGEGDGLGLVPGPKEIRMMPFGAGRRYCPGVGMATMRVRCLVAALVREFVWAPPVEGGGGVDLTELDGFFKAMKTPLRARITRRALNA